MEISTQTLGFCSFHERIIECGYKHDTAIESDDTLLPLLVAMRNCIPVRGEAWDRTLVVISGPGRHSSAVLAHRHAEAVAIYYVEVGGAPVRIEGRRYEPQPDECIYIPSDYLHEVPKHHARRVIVAMLVSGVELNPWEADTYA